MDGAIRLGYHGNQNLNFSKNSKISMESPNLILFSLMCLSSSTCFKKVQIRGRCKESCCHGNQDSKPLIIHIN